MRVGSGYVGIVSHKLDANVRKKPLQDKGLQKKNPRYTGIL